MTMRKDKTSSEKKMRRVGWFFVFWFGLAFINDWLMLKGIAMIPIVYFLNYHQVDPAATMEENAFVIIVHAALVIGVLYPLLRKKGLPGYPRSR